MNLLQLKKIALALTLFTGSSAFAQFSYGAPEAKQPKKETIAPTDLSRTEERGWFYFDDPKVPDPKDEQAPVPAPPPPREENPKKDDAPKDEEKDPCQVPRTWKPTCGFVHPGTDFEFQAKQRDALLNAMVMSNNDPKQVEAFQYYMRWVVERASEVANIWRYNMVQNPELDPSVKSPISSFGLRLMTDIRKGNDKEVFDLIKSEGGMIVVFTRDDCIYCHQMVSAWNSLTEYTTIPLAAASIQGACTPGLNFVECKEAPESLDPAQALKVTIVPATFLYVKPNTWLRIGNGVVDTDSMKTRTVQFFSAYRNALLKGVDNGQNGNPSVDFSGTAPTGAAVGVTPPSEESVEQFVKSLND